MHKKQFISIGVKNRNKKVEDLLSRLNLTDRLTVSEMELLDAPINYEDVFERLAQLRQDSLNFLKSELEIIEKAGEKNGSKK